MGPHTIGARALIKAASSDERDLAPGLTANGGFRKTGNVEQYAFKEENIEGICQSHLYVPNFLQPGGAMTITGYWHVDVFRPAHLSNIWSLVQIEHSKFELYKAYISYAKRWRYDYNWILAFRCLQAMTHTKNV